MLRKKISCYLNFITKQDLRDKISLLPLLSHNPFVLRMQVHPKLEFRKLEPHIIQFTLPLYFYLKSTSIFINSFPKQALIVLLLLYLFVSDLGHFLPFTPFNLLNPTLRSTTLASNENIEDLIINWYRENETPFNLTLDCFYLVIHQESNRKKSSIVALSHFFISMLSMDQQAIMQRLYYNTAFFSIIMMSISVSKSSMCHQSYQKKK